MSLDPTNKFVCCASDKGTIHVFSVTGNNESENKTSALSAMSGMIGYFGSKWSFS